MIYFVSGILIGSLGAFITIFIISGYTKKKGFFYKRKNSWIFGGIYIYYLYHLWFGQWFEKNKMYMIWKYKIFIILLLIWGSKYARNIYWRNER